MSRSRLNLFPWIAAACALAAIGWAVQGTTLPPADFTFINGTEVKSIDPSIVTGQPEGRLINALFEGLVRWHPETLEPIPGSAQSWEISDDQRQLTFHIRRDARWSNGQPVTAGDFHYSLRRLLDPRTAAEYAYQAWYIKNARRYSKGGVGVRIGGPVEVELNLPADAINSLRGRVLRGVLRGVIDASGDPVDPGQLANDSPDASDWTYEVELDGERRKFRYSSDADAEEAPPPPGVEWCRQVLLDFREVGVERTDDATLTITLENPTSYFLSLTGFYPLFPVNQECVEQFGSPQWTYPENIVCNGAFVPLFRHIRDRTRLVKNERYWNRDAVHLETVDVLAVEKVTTGLNLYLTGEADWNHDVPPPALRELLRADPPRKDLNPQPMLNSYFYLLNTSRRPLDDIRVRQALSLALDREEITTRILAAGEQPALSLVPPGLPGYDPPQTNPYDPERARTLLAAAGYPGGAGFPRLDILFNTHESHKLIAEVIRKQWQKNLGVNVTTRNEEWGSYLATQRTMQYNIARKGWIGDYADPNTFLDMFVTDGEQNNTGWSNAHYDRLIEEAASERDPQRRLEMLAEAETIIMEELPILPIYFYVSKNMVQPYVRGFYNNLQDVHPLSAISIDREGTTANPFLRGRQ